MTGAVLFTAQGTKFVADQDVLDSYLGTVGENGLRNGKGVYTFPNGCFQYSGEYVQGKKEGQGRLELSDGSYYSGTFQGGEICGEGQRVWADGSVLRGNFVLGEAEGKGEFQSSKGWTYTGSFKNNLPHGKGIRLYSNGGRYEGEFCDGKFHGYGDLKLADGYTYTGFWERGCPHGKGREVLISGHTFEGQLSSGKYHGTGSLVMPDGRVYREVAFLHGELEHPAVQMQLEYPKVVNKKNVEQPVPLEIGTLTPPDFRVCVRILCTAQEASDGAQQATTETQVMTRESGRTVLLRLQQGHDDPDDGMQPLKLPVFWAPKSTTAPLAATEAAQEQEQGTEETPSGEESLCAVTADGECSFQGFQIGGAGLAEVQGGPYTLVLSSAGLPDERILVQMSVAKGKKK